MREIANIENMEKDNNIKIKKVKKENVKLFIQKVKNITKNIKKINKKIKEKKIENDPVLQGIPLILKSIKDIIEKKL
ncbi:MAG: hypothetical protein BucCj_1270 [Buchnera aphidicola (Ceratovacuna japonica)]